jgi:hypothetical protein
MVFFSWRWLGVVARRNLGKRSFKPSGVDLPGKSAEGNLPGYI